MEKEVKIKSVCKYNGHTVKASKVVDLSLKFNYDELVNYVQSIQMLNENITVKVRVNGVGAKLGTFLIKEIKIDGDGEGTIKMASSMDHIDAAAVNSIVISEAFPVMFEAIISSEDEEGDQDG